jgi:hypothetical protein
MKHTAASSNVKTNFLMKDSLLSAALYPFRVAKTLDWSIYQSKKQKEGAGGNPIKDTLS